MSPETQTSKEQGRHREYVGSMSIQAKKAQASGENPVEAVEHKGSRGPSPASRRHADWTEDFGTLPSGAAPRRSPGRALPKTLS